ncbi:MAG: EutN/CcmL family microcompartment protein [Candidatus Thermoplasmatota archaeon]|jgi:microcompartment protein CcmK/EutM|nr:EutN/CcmL family microcompartment protein [Candidatus Thermoplasmatota archaeon]
MYIAKVVGTVVATQKVDTLKGIKLLLVQPLNDDRTPKGRLIAAGDALGTTGEGDFVYIVTKKEATFPFGGLVPLDDAIVGFIDEYHTDYLSLKR